MRRLAIALLLACTTALPARAQEEPNAVACYQMSDLRLLKTRYEATRDEADVRELFARLHNANKCGETTLETEQLFTAVRINYAGRTAYAARYK